MTLSRNSPFTFLISSFIGEHSSSGLHENSIDVVIEVSKLKLSGTSTSSHLHLYCGLFLSHQTVHTFTLISTSFQHPLIHNSNSH